MAAILRVKRRHTDEPLNALVISYKRQKIAENEETEATLTDLATVAKLAGTVQNQEDSVEHIIRGYTKHELEENFKQHPVDILNKARERMKQASAENRYKIVSCLRSLNNSSLNNSSVEDSEEQCMTVIDVEDSISEAREMEKDDNYVYDLYYVQTENDANLDENVSVYEFGQDLLFDNYRDAVDTVENESEDSNSESNWRNDYPDSEHSEGSIDEDDMAEAVKNITLNGDSDLSEEDDDLVSALDQYDVEEHGYVYAKYKARIKKELAGLDEDDSDLSEDFYEDDEDDETDEDNDSSMKQFYKRHKIKSKLKNESEEEDASDTSSHDNSDDN